MRTNKNIIALRKEASKANLIAILSGISLIFLPYLMAVNGSYLLAFLLGLALFFSTLLFACSAIEFQVQADQAQRILNY